MRMRALLRAHAPGERLDDAGDAREVLAHLAAFVTWLLREAHGWSESLDDIVPWTWTVVDETEAQLIGRAIVVGDQRETPVLVRWRLEPDRDAIAWLHCRLGVRGAGRSEPARMPLGSARTTEQCMALERDDDAVAWALRATYGDDGES